MAVSAELLSCAAALCASALAVASLATLSAVFSRSALAAAAAKLAATVCAAAIEEASLVSACWLAPAQAGAASPVPAEAVIAMDSALPLGAIVAAVLAAVSAVFRAFGRSSLAACSSAAGAPPISAWASEYAIAMSADAPAMSCAVSLSMAALLRSVSAWLWVGSSLYPARLAAIDPTCSPVMLAAVAETATICESWPALTEALLPPMKLDTAWAMVLLATRWVACIAPNSTTRSSS